MHNLIPQIIQENYRKGIMQGEFPAVGLFADLTGFSALTETMSRHGPHGAEVVAHVVGQLFGPLVESIFAQGGFVTHLVGDGIAALFPFEDPGNSHLLPPLASAIKIHKVMRKTGDQNTPYGRFFIQAKVGLAIGQTQWGIIESRDHHRAVYYFKGSSVEGSAEAEKQAVGGEIILEEEITRKYQGLVEVNPLENSPKRPLFYHLEKAITDLPEPKTFSTPEIHREIQMRFFPEQVIDHPPGGEFRQIINLFVNLPTINNETQLTSFMHTVFELQDRFGGMLDILDFGDKGSNILVFWGAPSAYENDTERALNFISGLQTLTSIPINAGITYQMSHVGLVGSSLFEKYTCFGRGVNLAARFMTTAPRGEIWVDENVYKRAHDQYEFDEIGKFTFKGFDIPQKVFTLVERKPEAETFYFGEMIGRQAEMDRLQAFVSPLWQGACPGVMVIWGEAGLGKSRLVHEFQMSKFFQERPVLWAICQTDEILREPLNPFRYWLQRFCGVVDTQPEARNKRRFNRGIDGLLEPISSIQPGLAAELDRLRSFLGALVGLHWPDSLFEQLDPQARYEQTINALILLFQVITLNQPVVIFIEDAHWLDTETQLFLPVLIMSLTALEGRQFPVAILTTSRKEEKDSILFENLPYQEIELTAINRLDLGRLAQQRLGGPLVPELLRLVLEKAEGNPFFVEQILLFFQEEDLLEQSPDGWKLRVGTSATWMPRDVESVLVARLDRLTLVVKKVVRTAAVLGREFEVKLLSLMLQDDVLLYDHLESATKSDIWASLDELRYIFKHIMLRDTAYSMLTMTQRQTLHMLAIESMENQYASDLTEHAPELVYHCEQANLFEKACVYLKLSAGIRRDRYQNRQAVDDYTRLLGLLPEDDLVGRMEALLEREALLHLIGDIEARHRDLLDLDILLKKYSELAEDQPGQSRLVEFKAEVGDRWAVWFLDTSDLNRAIERSLQAEKTSRLAMKPRLAIQTLVTTAMAFTRQGFYPEAATHAQKSLNLALEENDPIGESQALNMLGLIAWEQNDNLTALQFYEESYLISHSNKLLRNEAMVLNNLGNVAGSLGDLSACQDYFERTLSLTRQIGDKTKEGLVLGNLGWITGMLGDYPTACSYCEQNIRISRQSGDFGGVSAALINLSAYTSRQGNNELARSYALEAEELTRKTGDRSFQAWACTYLGHALVELSEYPQAISHYEQALAIRGDLKQPVLAYEPLAGLARIALAEGNIKRAIEIDRHIGEYLEAGGSFDGTDEPLRIYLTHYQVLQAIDDKHSLAVLETASKLLYERARKISDEVQRRNFLDISYHRAIISAVGE